MTEIDLKNPPKRCFLLFSKFADRERIYYHGSYLSEKEARSDGEAMIKDDLLFQGNTTVKVFIASFVREEEDLEEVFLPEENPREKGDDDGVEYGHPAERKEW